MLYLIFQAGDDRFALCAASVIEIVPLVRLRAVPHAPEGVAGFFNYRGAVIPVVDMVRVISGRSGSTLFSTRIVVARLGEQNDHGQACDTGRVVGLVAEKATEIIDLDEDMFEDTGLHIDDAPYLGEVVSGKHLHHSEHGKGKHSLVQRITPSALLTDDIRQALRIAESPELRESENSPEYGNAPGNQEQTP
jgi:chemotaxis-related protein WspB